MLNAYLGKFYLALNRSPAEIIDLVRSSDRLVRSLHMKRLKKRKEAAVAKKNRKTE